MELFYSLHYESKSLLFLKAARQWDLWLPPHPKLSNKPADDSTTIKALIQKYNFVDRTCRRLRNFWPEETFYILGLFQSQIAEFPTVEFILLCSVVDRELKEHSFGYDDSKDSKFHFEFDGFMLGHIWAPWRVYLSIASELMDSSRLPLSSFRQRLLFSLRLHRTANRCLLSLISAGVFLGFSVSRLITGFFLPLFDAHNESTNANSRKSLKRSTYNLPIETPYHLINQELYY